MKEYPEFDDHHGVFGVISDEASLELLDKMNDLGNDEGTTDKRVYISNCGVRGEE